LIDARLEPSARRLRRDRDYESRIIARFGRT
jgi:hypothetical protein